MALCRVSRGFCRVFAAADASAAHGTICVLTSLEALDLDILHVLVLWVVADPDESLREDDRFESCDVFRVTSHELALRFGSSSLSGMPQWWWFCRHESLLDELKFSLEDTSDARLCVFC